RMINLTRTFLRFILGGASGQNFLGNPVIPLLLNLTPAKFRHKLALQLLGISPHYFINIDKDRILSEQKVGSYLLNQEHDRNKESRHKISEKLVKPFVNKDMDVLDFGCGPGYLSYAVAKYAKSVIGTDISKGVIKCAEILNSGKNIKYVLGKMNGLSKFQDKRFDLIYTFAVFQHLNDLQFEKFLREFKRILKPGGKVTCHIPIFSSPSINKLANKRVESNILYRRIYIPMYYRKLDYVLKVIKESGFTLLNHYLGSKYLDCGDDICKQHIFELSN
ncbi:class I SAM-dependent methyltransferase, partial [bacterium]|nr:class I SAM-dependent methyltransferase [bacterium]